MTHVTANTVPHHEDELLVRSFLALFRDHSNRAAAAELGVSEATIRRWRLGNVATPLQTKTRLRLRNCIGDPAGNRGGRAGPPEDAAGGAVTHGDAFVGGTVRSAARGGSGRRALDLFGSVDRIARHIGAIAPPGQDKARKRYVLEGIRHVITALEPLPAWWYALVERVESGEI